MTSVPVLESELALLQITEAILQSLTNLPSAFHALDTIVEAIIQQEITTIQNELACYVRGTMIATEAGEVAVERLKVGDVVLTASGGARAVVWVGSRGFDLDAHSHPNPSQIYPVLVKANAFGDNRPTRDLWLSPGHNVFVDGALIPVRSLINGISIVRQPLTKFEYWHVELDEHDIILAEGLTAESYLDTGNRAAFIDGADFIEQHPDFGPRHWAETCAPLVHEGPKLTKVREYLLSRTENFGFVITEDSDLHLLAENTRIDPVDLGNNRFAFLVPPGSRDIALVSRTFVPTESEPASADDRALGICVAELQINGKTVDLWDEDQIGDGWHKLERWNEETCRRWTTGFVRLPGSARLVVVALDSPGRYTVRDSRHFVRLVA